MRRALLAGAAVLVALVPIATAGATGHAAKPKCKATRVLLLGSYPAEIRANLDVEKRATKQPTVLSGHDFYRGTLAGREVILGLSDQSPAQAYAVTKLAIKHFGCISAVVFEGTAGGGSDTKIGDVAVPSEWTYNGAPFRKVNAKALSLLKRVLRKPPELVTRDAVNDGNCSCAGPSSSSAVATIVNRPTVIVGGAGITDPTGVDDTCSASGSELEGCNPCPPCPPATAPRTSASTASVVTIKTKPKLTTSTGIAPAGYLADDEQTTAAQKAADQAHIPFIAFRGISDTSAVGDAWPLEFLIYQQLAADNAAIVARAFIADWRG